MEVYNSEFLVSTPIVSVVVIAYNHKDYISDCLDNIINQIVDFPIALGRYVSRIRKSILAL